MTLNVEIMYMYYKTKSVLLGNNLPFPCGWYELVGLCFIPVS